MYGNGPATMCVSCNLGVCVCVCVVQSAFHVACLLYSMRLHIHILQDWTTPGQARWLVPSSAAAPHSGSLLMARRVGRQRRSFAH